MDYEVLVSDKIDEGGALIAELTRDVSIDLAVAFWVRRSEGGHWSLYLGSAALASKKIGDAFYIINLAMTRIQRKVIGLSDVDILSPSDPIASKAIELRDSQPRTYLTSLPYYVYSPNTFSDPSIQVAYIYPRNLGRLDRDEVVRTVATVMSRSNIRTQYSFTLQDGSSFKAVPMGIERVAFGELRIVLHDLAGNTDRTISADEVVSIQ